MLKYSWEPSKGEKNSGEILTEQAGSVPVENQVRNLTDAGLRLMEFRRQQFPGFDDESSDYSGENFQFKDELDVLDEVRKGRENHKNRIDNDIKEKNVKKDEKLSSVTDNKTSPEKSEGV